MKAAPIHSLPGRVRFRVPPGAIAKAGGTGLARALGAISGVKSAAVNPRTGGVLVRYDPRRVSAAEIYRTLGEIHSPGAVPAPPGAKPKETIAWSWIGWQLFRLLLPPALKPLGAQTPPLISLSIIAFTLLNRRPVKTGPVWPQARSFHQSP